VAARVSQSLVACTALVITSVIAACGSRAHPPALDDSPAAPLPSGGGGLLGGDAGSKPPDCGTLADGGSCGCEDVPLFTEPPNMYFVLDRSGSMQEDDKWDTIRLAVADVMRSIGPRANFGAAVFPGPSSVDECATGVEAMSVRQGDPPTGTSQDGPTVTALLAATNSAAGGGTPTSATLKFLLPGLTALKGKTFVVLATDGGPNCNNAASCSIATCIPNIEGAAGCDATTNCCAAPNGDPSNCLDDTATIAAVNNLKAAGIPTYVIGVPGSGPYAGLLDQLATTGGTAQATGATKYYAIDSTDQAAFLKTMKSVAAKVTATCTFTLKGTPDPSHVNVYFDEVVVPQNPVNGWTIMGGTITLVGTACQQVLDGDVLDVRIIAGCPTVVK
jgi:hypothetical protein